MVKIDVVSIAANKAKEIKFLENSSLDKDAIKKDVLRLRLERKNVFVYRKEIKLLLAQKKKINNISKNKKEINSYDIEVFKISDKISNILQKMLEIKAIDEKMFDRIVKQSEPLEIN